MCNIYHRKRLILIHKYLLNIEGQRKEYKPGGKMSRGDLEQTIPKKQTNIKVFLKLKKNVFKLTH